MEGLLRHVLRGVRELRGVRLRGARAALYCPAARGGKRGGVAVSGRRGPCAQRLRCGAGAVTPRDGRRALQLSHGRALCMFCCCRVLRAASHRVYPGGGTLPRAAGRGLGRHEAVGRGVQESPRNVDVSVGGAPRGHASGTSAKLPDCPRVLVRKGRGVRRGMRAGCAGAGGRGVFQGVDERVHVPLQTAKIQADDDVEKTFGLGQSVSPGIRKAFRRGGSRPPKRADPSTEEAWRRGLAHTQRNRWHFERRVSAEILPLFEQVRREVDVCRLQTAESRAVPRIRRSSARQRSGKSRLSLLD